MKRVIATLLTGALGTLASADLSAQDIPSPYEFIEETQSVGGFLGYLWTAAGPGGINVGDAFLAGARYNVRLAGPATGEVSVAAGRGTRPVLQQAPGEEEDFTAVGDANTLMVVAEAGIRFMLTGARTWNDLAPYLVGTGGVVADAQRSRSLEEELGIPRDDWFHFGPTLAVGLGAGTDWFPAPGFSLRLEVRNHIWRVSPPGGLTELDAEWTNNIGLSVGAALHF